jgi:D-beta-D-heptose 7-phosphate kinase/D-beta-D-heptose 1-phosphate adenosyltransferase
MAGVDCCVLSDYGKGVVTPQVAKGLIQLARCAGKASIVDPKGNNWLKYRGATVVKPNFTEFQQLLGRQITTDVEWRSARNQLAELLPETAVVVSRGEQGMTLLEQGKQPLHIPAEEREVLDVTGAGDTVIATLALCCAAGLSLGLAAQHANAAAGLVVGKIGTATVGQFELIAAFDQATAERETHDRCMSQDDRIDVTQRTAQRRASRSISPRTVSGEIWSIAPSH